MMRRAEYGDYGGGRRTERDLDQYNDRPAGGYGYGGGGGGDRAVDRGDAPPRKFGRRDDPDEQKRKMFCGGLSLETTKDAVERYFTRFGPIQEVIMVPDSRTGRPRGFCFIIFQDESSLDLVLGERTHTIDGRNVECTRAVGREEVRNNPGSIRKTKRVYLARTKDLSEDEIREYFEEYIGKDMGHVEIVELLRNKDTGVHRGFGFINFSTFEAADKVCSQKDHKIGAQDVVAIKAEPKSERPPERYDSGPGYGAGSRGPPGSNLSRSSLAAYNGGGAAGGRDYRTIMAPNERMVAPALQASLAGRPQTTLGSGKTAADLRRMEEEIMIREEQLRIKEMKLQLQTARLAAGEARDELGMFAGAANETSVGRPSAVMERQAVLPAAPYSDRGAAGMPTNMLGHSYPPAPVMSGDAYGDRPSAGGPIRTRDRYAAVDHAPSGAYEAEYVGSVGGSYYAGGTSSGGGGAGGYY